MLVLSPLGSKLMDLGALLRRWSTIYLSLTWNQSAMKWKSQCPRRSNSRILYIYGWRATSIPNPGRCYQRKGVPRDDFCHSAQGLRDGTDSP